MTTRKARRARVGLMALGTMTAAGGCDAGTYETDVMTPAMIIQTNTETGEIRACAVVRLINDAASSVRVRARAMEADRFDEGVLTDEELGRRERAILEREESDTLASPERIPEASTSNEHLVECTHWTAR